MYLSFYGLNEKPFNLTPDANFLYPSQIHREVLGHLLFGINNRRGFILITGEVGAGKTTLCRVLLNQLDENTEVAFILNSYLTEFELLKAINEDLGIATTGRTRKELIDELNRFLLDQRAQGKNIVVIIDEAQNLSIPVLEQLRMLSNLETEKEKLLQIVLVGQPELRKLLQNEKIRQLNQRITVRHHISPLSKAELKEYVYYRLNVAGSRGNIVFNDSAIDEIFRYSRGIPRAINVLCDQTLLVGYVANTRRITRDMVRKAVREVWGTQKDDIAGGTRYRVRTVALRAFAGICIMAVLAFTGFFFVTRIKGSRTYEPPSDPTAGQNGHKQLVSAEETTITEDKAPDKQEMRTAMVETSQAEQEILQLQTPDNDFASSSLMVAAIRSGGGRMLGKELNDIGGPLVPIGPQSFSLNGEDESPADVAEIDSWATDVDATVDLLRLWKVEQQYVHAISQRFKNKTVEPQRVAETAKMGYAVFKTDLTTLRMLDLPAIAEINAGKGRKRFAVISALHGSRATVLVSSTEMEIDADKLAPLLTGNMVIYCGDSFVNPQVLHSGMDIDIGIRKLQDYLKELDYFDGNCSGWFAEDTQNAVLEFQADNGLDLTGYVTGYMKLLIYSRFPHEENEVPRLAR